MNLIKISKIIDEATNIKTFYFNHTLNSLPGQFVMLWVPEYDQKPFSIAYDDGESFGLTIFKRGPATSKLFNMQVGDKIGIEGSFGTNFSIKPNTHYIMVAGGYGAAPLGYLSSVILSDPERARANEGESKDPFPIDFLLGARTANLLLFEEKLKDIPGLNLHIATDDGSKGHKGYVTDLLKSILEERDPSAHPSAPSGRSGFARDDNECSTLVVTCGPELMEKKVLDICNEYDVDCEISIERYMKCGYGICGQCAVDPIGICMCQEGPIVKRELANKITEFGIYHRDKSGKIIYF
ncbi:dihydroorotate dehydrogenase electron transfer subunit [Patescibacteria group bacterium]|nr:dihydroorotate dehydrogenase electron transfer subunit [Patescibacteria group bacterium]